MGQNIWKNDQNWEKLEMLLAKAFSICFKDVHLKCPLLFYGKLC